MDESTPVEAVARTGARETPAATDAVAAYASLLAGHARLSAQVRLFHALARAGGMRSTGASLLATGEVVDSRSRRRLDNARRALHARARALRETLVGLGRDHGQRIGSAFLVAWSADEGPDRLYSLCLVPWGAGLLHTGGEALAILRAKTAQLLRVLSGTPDEAPTTLPHGLLQTAYGLARDVFRTIRHMLRKGLLALGRASHEA